MIAGMQPIRVAVIGAGYMGERHARIYAGLPDKPRISPLVDAWKGILKPLALAGIAFTAVAGFFHWVLAGPNEVQPEDEAEARRLLHPADDSR